MKGKKLLDVPLSSLFRPQLKIGLLDNKLANPLKVGEECRPFMSIARGTSFAIGVDSTGLCFTLFSNVLKDILEDESIHMPVMNMNKWRQGNSLELFFDTRGGTSRTLTRFSHHFVVFPHHVEGIFSKEVTKFRGAESRALTSPNSITLQKCKKGEIYSLAIPWESFYGLNLEDSPTIAFAFRLNTPKTFYSFPQTIKNLESNPTLWAELL